MQDAIDPDGVAFAAIGSVTLVVALLLGVFSIFWIAGSAGRLRGYPWAFMAIGIAAFGLVCVILTSVLAARTTWIPEPASGRTAESVATDPNYPYSATAIYDIDFGDLDWKPALEPRDAMDWLATISGRVQKRVMEIAEELDLSRAKGLHFEVATATNPDDHSMKTSIEAKARRERGYEKELSRVRREIEKILDEELGRRTKSRTWSVSMAIEPGNR